MVQAMFLAHLLGDYVLQTDGLARRKSRSIWGLLIHGMVVTFSFWICSLPFMPNWWPYALGLGAVHTLIDTVRVKIGRVGPTTTLILFLTDQAAHALTIAVSLVWSGWWSPRIAETAFGVWLQTNHRLAFIAGYVLLTMPAWVSVHFLVRGMGVESTSLPGRPGEKYVCMIERSLIATLVLVGQFLLIPLVVSPRLALDGRNGRVEAEQIGYVSELLISVGLAIAVGLFLRGLG
jgi:hypothetical protein